MAWGGGLGLTAKGGEIVEMVCILNVVWFHGITTIKTHHVVPFKWMSFIAYKLCLNKVDLKNT